jgi:L-rhamnose mutarotase
MKTYCLANDLKDDPQLIEEYEQHHKAVWAENLAGIRASGILTMDIFRTGNRLFMIMTTDDNFSFEAKAKVDASNIKLQEWETLMDKYQQRIPWAKPGEKWVLMHQIFTMPD